MLSHTWLLALLLLAIGARADNTLPKNAELDVFSDMVDKRNILSVNSFIGLGTEKPVISQRFDFNFGINSVVVGDVDTAKWGIQCIDNKDKHVNSCKIDDGAVDKEDFIYSSRFLYKDAHLVLRLFSDEVLDIKDENTLPIKLVTSNNKWPLDKAGIIGLGPNGNFSKYVSNLYKGDVELLFGFNVEDTKANNEGLKFSNHVVVNPVYLDNLVLARFDYTNKDEAWSQTADVAIDKIDDMAFKDTNVCFSTMSSEILILANPRVLCDRVRAKVCNGKIGNECTGDIYKDFSTAPVLSFTFGDKKLTFEGKDYLYLDNNIVSCRFGDLSDIRSEQVCPEETEVAIGRLFFSKYLPSMTFNGEKKTFRFIKEYNFKPDPKPTPSGNGPSLLVILLIVALIIVVGLLVFFFLRRRNADNTEEHYRDL